MSDSSRRSWDEAVDALRRAASEVRAAAGHGGPPGAEEDAAAARLKADVSRLERSASDLGAKLSGGLHQGRADLESSFDRERADASAGQIRASIEELASLAGKVTTDIAAAASTSLKQAEPELQSAVRALEDVAGSAASWVRAVIDPPGDRERSRPSAEQPPLEEM